MINKTICLFVAFILAAYFITGCVKNKDDIIKCSKCGTSLEDLQKQYEENRKTN